VKTSPTLPLCSTTPDCVQMNVTRSDGRTSIG
jgi:hypothetical protein